MILEFLYPRIMTRAMIRHGVPQYKIIADGRALENYVNQQLPKRKHNEGLMLKQFAWGRTLDQIGESFDLGQERVRQIIMRVMHQLLKEEKRKELPRWKIYVYQETIRIEDL